MKTARAARVTALRKSYDTKTLSKLAADWRQAEADYLADSKRPGIQRWWRLDRIEESERARSMAEDFEAALGYKMNPVQRHVTYNQQSGEDFAKALDKAFPQLTFHVLLDGSVTFENAGEQCYLTPGPAGEPWVAVCGKRKTHVMRPSEVVRFVNQEVVVNPSWSDVKRHAGRAGSALLHHAKRAGGLARDQFGRFLSTVEARRQARQDTAALRQGRGFDKSHVTIDGVQFKVTKAAYKGRRGEYDLTLKDPQGRTFYSESWADGGYATPFDAQGRSPSQVSGVPRARAKKPGKTKKPRTGQKKKKNPGPAALVAADVAGRAARGAGRAASQGGKGLLYMVRDAVRAAKKNPGADRTVSLWVDLYPERTRKSLSWLVGLKIVGNVIKSPRKAELGKEICTSKVVSVKGNLATTSSGPVYEVRW